MNFLAPLFLLGAIGVALPVVFHLIRRRARKRVPFSSVMFLHPSPPRLSRQMRFEHVALLLLRCLVICLLAAGFARPFFAKPWAPPGQTQANRRWVLLLDTSASMRREGLWAAAVEQANATLREVSPSDQVAVMAFDRQLRTLFSFEQWSAANLAERIPLAAQSIAQAQPGWFSTHLGAALTRAAEILTEGDADKPTTRRLVVISDLQEGARLDGLQGYVWPRGVEVTFEAIKAKRTTNAGLQWLAGGGEALGLAATASERVLVANSRDARREQFQVTWADVPAAAAANVYVPPGQSRMVTLPRPTASTSGTRLQLTGDDAEFDNTVYLVRPEARSTTVVVLSDEPGTDPAQMVYYLKRAFDTNGQQLVQLAVRPSSQTPAAAEAAATRLVIVADEPGEAWLTQSQQMLSQGGTVLLVMRTPALARTLARLAGEVAVPASEAAVRNYSMLGQIEFGHPLLAPFSDPRYSDFTHIHFWKHRRLELSALPNARVLAKFDDGDPALVEVPRGKGRVLVLTSGWQPGDSQLALSTKFVPLLYAILDQAGGIASRPTQYQIGDEVELESLLRGRAGEPVTVRRPDGTEVTLPATAASFAQTDLPGLYSIVSGGPLVQFAVNLDPGESRTAPLPVEQLERLGVPLKAKAVDLARQAQRQQHLARTELEQQQKLWRWLILATLVVLVVETWLAGRLSSRSTARTLTPV